MTRSLTADLAYLTEDVPGVGGMIKQRQEDFLVQEEPATPPTGEGEHLMIYLEKRGRTTLEIVRRLSKSFGVPRQDIGYAGMKDKHAVTRQHFTLRVRDDRQVANGLRKFAFHPQATILWHERHDRKLRRGHHGGNRFVIYLRQVEPAQVIQARNILDRLIAHGVPNYVGDQRFGYRQNGHTLGAMLLRGQYRAFVDELLGRPDPVDSPNMHRARVAYEAGEYREALRLWPKQLRHDRQALDALRQGCGPQEAVACMDRHQLEFLACGLQSAIFNAVLDQRLRSGTYEKLLAGDLASLRDNHAIFAVDQATADLENAPQARMNQCAISPTGPMWGPSMPAPEGEVATLEAAVLAGMDLTQELLTREDTPLPEGRRRSLRMIVEDPDLAAGADEHGPYIRLAFQLARGSFATMVLREIMKTDMYEAAHTPRGDEGED